MRRLILLTSTLVLTIMVGAHALDTMEGYMPFQGYLVDNTGAAVPDGVYHMVFTIYDDSTGGYSYWTEEHDVTVTGGGFSVMLGSDEPLVDTTLWEFNTGDVDRWMGVTVGTDSEMYPRTKLGSTPYAGFSHGVSGHIQTRPGGVRMRPTIGDISSDTAWIDMHTDSNGAAMEIGYEPFAGSWHIIGFYADTAGAYSELKTGDETIHGPIVLDHVVEDSAFRIIGGNDDQAGNLWPMIEHSINDGGASMTMRDLADITFDTTLIEHKVDSNGASFVMRTLSDISSDTTSIGMKADSSGPSLNMVQVDDTVTKTAVFTSGDIIYKYIDEASFDTICDRHYVSDMGSNLIMSKNSDTGLVLSSGSSGGSLVMFNTADTDKSILDAHSLSIMDGSKATIAGLSASGLTLTNGAADGYVLTSDASGFGTWQPSTSGGGSCWECPGDYTILADITDNVGMGITNPYYKLEVGGSSDATNFIRINSGTLSGLMFGDASGTSGLIRYLHTDDHMEFWLKQGVTLSEKMRITSGGYVGIGTDSPVANLTVNGKSRIYPGGVDPWGLSNTGLVIGKEGSDGYARSESDSASIFFPAHTNDYAMIYSRTKDMETDLVLRVMDDPNDDILLMPSGNVGINKASPEFKLHVYSPDTTTAYFESDAATTSNRIVQSIYTGTSGNYHVRGFYGKAEAGNGYGYGGQFFGGYTGAMGWCTVTEDQPTYNYHGLIGRVDGENYDGINIGVKGYSQNGIGTNIGVGGSAFGESALMNVGIYGWIEREGDRAIEGSLPDSVKRWAGYFWGNVNVTDTVFAGRVQATSKSFLIDHPLDPENKYLQHSCIESPDMKNVYDGTVVLDENGTATIKLPDYFEALNTDFRYQLTCIGGYAPVYVAEEINDNQFKIAGGKAGLKISWQITGIRNDASARADRIIVEIDKKPEECGKYIDPYAFGFGAEKSVTNVKKTLPVTGKNEENKTK